jgi:hypothetical protein
MLPRQMTKRPNFGNQFARDRFERSCAVDVAGLGDVIGGAERQGFQSYSRALFGQAAEHDDRNAAVDFAQFTNRFEAIHLRHLDVKQDDVWLGSDEFRQPDAAIDRRGGYLEQRILANRRGKRFANHDRVIHQQHAFFVALQHSSLLS